MKFLFQRFALALLLAVCGSVAVCAEELDRRGTERFWAFDLPVARELPVLENNAWALWPIDRFVGAMLDANDLRPAPPADKLTLLRRVYFDLVGLPPAPRQQHDFLADTSPIAFEKVVDRLLASAHYGERWGRHWLDVARYADSNGLDENVAHGNAWRYRDYVINSWNQDKAYDQFLMEQLAGDLVPAGDDRARRHELLTATGFLVLGPKVLAEVDAAKQQMDIVDEQVDTVARALMGLTMGCARCHNHKFDPLKMEDYYALAGIFKSTRTMENFKLMARWHENVVDTEAAVQRRREHDQRVTQHKEHIKKVVDEATSAVKARVGDDSKNSDNLESQFPEATRSELKQLREELAEMEKTAPVLASAMGVIEGDIADEPIHLRGDPLKTAQVVPRGFPAVLTSVRQPAIAADRSGRLILAQWLTDGQHPLTGRVMANRIWRWHFGSGLVATPDNFGRLGARPENQPLLDWLAVRFVEDGWSIKKMHRRMLLSASYRMSSRYDAWSATIDPENRLHHRFSMRRLEAEPLRDALLYSSGLLDTRMGESLLHVKNREFLFNHTSKDETKYTALCRAVYLPVIRNHLYDMFQLFDYSDASTLNGDRTTSTIAPQALFMLNSALMHQVAEHLAGRLLALPDEGNRWRVWHLYERSLGRPPTEGELIRAESYLKRFARGRQPDENGQGNYRRQAWTALCHVILASNEFSYVR